MNLSGEALAEFRAAIVAWFEREGRDYPWRRTHDPYAIMVSELMLQQTQVATVLGRGFYERWMRQFPDVTTLADASEDEILKAWEGLGYYRRARLLQQAARAIVTEHGGVFPTDAAAIRALPGVGDYTAGAVRSFAFNEAAPMVDGNIARVLARLFDYRDPVDSTLGKRTLNAWSGKLAPVENARAFQSGLMELGQRICTPRSPDCRNCPVESFCQAEEPGSLPVKNKRPEIEAVWEWAAFLREGDRVLLQREAGKRRLGLWKLPVLADAPGREEILRLEYGITRYRVTLAVVRGGMEDAELPGTEWVELARLDELAMAAPFRRALSQILARDGGGWLL